MATCHLVLTITTGAHDDKTKQDYDFECVGTCGDDNGTCTHKSEKKYYKGATEIPEASKDQADRWIGFVWCTCDPEGTRPTRCHTELKTEAKKQPNGTWTMKSSVVCMPPDCCNPRKRCRPKLLSEENIAKPASDDGNEYLVEGQAVETYKIQTWKCTCVTPKFL